MSYSRTRTQPSLAAFARERVALFERNLAAKRTKEATAVAAVSPGSPPIQSFYDLEAIRLEKEAAAVAMAAVSEDCFFDADSSFEEEAPLGPGFTTPVVKAHFVHCVWTECKSYVPITVEEEEEDQDAVLFYSPVPSVSWEEISALCWAVTSLQEVVCDEFIRELPGAPFPLGGLAYFRARSKSVRLEREELLRQSVPIALAAASAPRCSVSVATCNWAKEQVFVACSPISAEIAESSAAQQQQRDEGGIPTILQVRDRLKNRHKKLVSPSGKGFVFKEAGTSRTIEDGGVELTENDVFHRMGIVRSWRTPSYNKTFTSCVRPIQQETVRMPRLRSGEKLHCVPIFSDLPRDLENMVRKLLEAGWRNTSSVCTDLLIQSHVGVGTPLSALITIVDARTDNATEALLCGAMVFLGNDVAKFLSTPLINFPLSKEIVDIEQYVGGLKLITYLNNVEGFHEGTPLFSYGTVEFQEHRPSVSTVTRTRESWDELCRTNQRQGFRVQAGFNTIKPVEKEICPIISDFPDFDLVSVPRNVQRPVLVGASGVDVPFARSHSVRVPGYVFDGSSRLSVERGRVSRQDDVSVARHSTSLFNSCAPVVISDVGNLIHATNFQVAADAKCGVSVAILDLRAIITSSTLPIYWKWWECNMANLVFTFEFEVPAGPFSGLALAMSVDWYDHLDVSKLSSTHDPIIMGMYPTTVFTLREGGLHTYSFSTAEIAGHGVSAINSAFGIAPKAYLYVYTTNQQPMAAIWHLACKIFLDVEPTTTFLQTPYCSWPPVLNDEFTLDRWLPPLYFEAGSAICQRSISLDFGAIVNTGKGNAMSAQMAYLSAFQGVGGVLHCTFMPTSSIFVNAQLVATMSHSNSPISTANLWRMPHVRLDPKGCSFALPIRSEYLVAPTRPSAVAEAPHLIIRLVGGVTLPKDQTSKYEFCIKFDRISALQAPMRVVSLETWYGWFILDTFAVDNCSFIIPARIHDLKVDNAKVEFFHNPFSHLVATTGLMCGPCDLEFTWDFLGKYGEHEGMIGFVSGYGDTSTTATFGRVVTVPLHVGRWTQAYHIGSFAGATTGTFSGQYVNFIKVLFAKATRVNSFRVNIRPHAGFSFYGRSASRLTS